jgi:hypothetical protein
VDALWRLCASSRLADHRSVFHSIKASPEQAVNFFRKMSTIPGKCQLFQERVKLSRKNTVNLFRKTANICQPKSGKDTLQRQPYGFPEKVDIFLKKLTCEKGDSPQFHITVIMWY